jgi:cytochrome c biogenesis protein CcmG, thiol:disulfide interchange protein DsbE
VAIDRVYRPVAIAACLALVGFIAYAVVSATHQETGSFPNVPAPSALHAGEFAPAFNLARLGGGEPVTFAGHADEPAVVNFFASWCPNCVAELDAFGSVSKGASPIRFLGVDSDDSATKTAEALLETAGISYPVGVDRSGSIADRYLVSALPVTFFIAPSGAVRGEIFGAATAAQLRTWVERLQTPGMR